MGKGKKKARVPVENFEEDADSDDVEMNGNEENMNGSSSSEKSLYEVLVIFLSEVDNFKRFFKPYGVGSSNFSGANYIYVYICLYVHVADMKFVLMYDFGLCLYFNYILDLS